MHQYIVTATLLSFLRFIVKLVIFNGFIGWFYAQWVAGSRGFYINLFQMTVKVDVRRRNIMDSGQGWSVILCGNACVYLSSLRSITLLGGGTWSFSMMSGSWQMFQAVGGLHLFLYNSSFILKYFMSRGILQCNMNPLAFNEMMEAPWNLDNFLVRIHPILKCLESLRKWLFVINSKRVCVKGVIDVSQVCWLQIVHQHKWS